MEADLDKKIKDIEESLKMDQGLEDLGQEPGSPLIEEKEGKPGEVETSPSRFASDIKKIFYFFVFLVLLKVLAIIF